MSSGYLRLEVEVVGESGLLTSPGCLMPLRPAALCTDLSDRYEAQALIVTPGRAIPVSVRKVSILFCKAVRKVSSSSAGSSLTSAAMGPAT
jgi:hypothetical protein